VLSNRANQLSAAALDSKVPRAPERRFNLGHTSNTIPFPTAMHIASLIEMEDHLLACAASVASAIERKAEEWQDLVKDEGEHISWMRCPFDRWPEWSGWARQIRDALETDPGPKPVFRASSGRHGRRHRASMLHRSSGRTFFFLPPPPTPPGNDRNDTAGRPFVTAAQQIPAQGSARCDVAAMGAVRGLAVAPNEDRQTICAGSPPVRLRRTSPPAEENEPGSSNHARER